MTHRPAPAEEVLRLLGGKMVSQALSTAADLGLADALAETSMTVDGLAERLGCDARMLGRLMGLLEAEGLLCSEDGLYSTTPLGQELRDDRLGPLASFMGSAGQWAPWAMLRRAIRTGASAFELTHGMDLYRWLQAHPEDARLYNRGVDRFTAEQARSLARDYDFGETRHVVDVGGGHGTMLMEVLTRWPHVRGTLFDIPHVVDAARPRFRAAGLEDRCAFVGGDFRERVPAGGDIYLLKHVLHNWDDPTAQRILGHCRSAIADEGRLLVVEGILPPGAQHSTSRMMDLEMMVLFAHGRERTKAELKRLFADAGLKLDRYTAPLGHFARLLTASAR